MVSEKATKVLRVVGRLVGVWWIVLGLVAGSGPTAQWLNAARAGERVAGRTAVSALVCALTVAAGIGLCVLPVTRPEEVRPAPRKTNQDRDS